MPVISIPDGQVLEGKLKPNKMPPSKVGRARKCAIFS